MTVVFETGGKQFRVNEGDVLYVEKLDVAEGETVEFDRVLAAFEGEKSKFGTPFLAGVKVSAKVLKQGKNKKIIVFKMKSKKNYRRKQGHRQPFTKLQIEKITV